VSDSAAPDRVRDAAQLSPVPAGRTAGVPWRTCAVLGLGGLFAGVTGPLLSTFVPIAVRDVLGNSRTLIGLVMAIDNVLLLLLVPWAGARSDRIVGRGGRRTDLIVGGFLLAATGMAVLPWAGSLGIAGLIGAMVVLYAGINTQRSPFQALLADAVPSRYRSLATGSVTFQMCAGAIAFLMLGRVLGMRPAFVLAGGTVLLIAVAVRAGVHEPQATTEATEATGSTLLAIGRSVLTGSIPGLRPVFVASLLLQLTFQTFATWFALHGSERFGATPEALTLGFIAWAFGGVLGALPAGALGMRLGRRMTMVVGLLVMATALLGVDRVATLEQAAPLLLLASAAWTLPVVNAYPMFVEPIPRGRRGSLGAVFLLTMALAGVIGDPLNGRVFDVAGSYRPLFLLMASYTALALLAILTVPRGTGEAAPRSDTTIVV